MALLDLFARKKTSCRPLVNVEATVVRKYDLFKQFLALNRQALGAIARLEELYYGGTPFNSGQVEDAARDIVATTRQLAATLTDISGGRYQNLSTPLAIVQDRIHDIIHRRPEIVPANAVLSLAQVTPEMMAIAGGKATNLAEVRNNLELPVPDGFVVTTTGFEWFLRDNNLPQAINRLLAEVSPDDPVAAERQCGHIQELILSTPTPPELKRLILAAYQALERRVNQPGVAVAVRSSAVGEDSEASFAGQYATVLNVQRDRLITAYKQVLASKYTPRAVFYRLRYGLDDLDTPMAVAVIQMVEAKASGVMYTTDPSRPEAKQVKITSILGLGEQLVSGEASPDAFFLDKRSHEVVRTVIGRKESGLFAQARGGTALKATTQAQREAPSLEPHQIRALYGYGRFLEEYFGAPQDVEWAMDEAGHLFVLQSRPLGLVANAEVPSEARVEYPGHPILLAGGLTASPGTACGPVCRIDSGLRSLCEGGIIVARTASPDLAGYVGKIGGIITDVGSAASHLASVVREFGVPALFDTGRATELLREGQEISLSATTQTVYAGCVPELAESIRPVRKHIFDSPMAGRLKAVLEHVSHLNLTDPKSPEFRPDNCRTVHDVIRFAHEQVMHEMFGLVEERDDSLPAARVKFNIPLMLHVIDLGGGLRAGLTECDQVVPEDMTSVPMRALWRGLAHPGINWTSAVGLGAKNVMDLMTSSMTTAETPGGDSFAILSRDYVNLSAKFGYHFASVDAFVGDEDPGQNHASIQFSGGAGTMYGKSLRLNYLAEVLSRLGFRITITGDLLEANLADLPRPAMEEALDQVGRLLAASRLLDVAIPNQTAVEQMVAAFFRGDYDFSAMGEQQALPGFYTHSGNWREEELDGVRARFQDGSTYATGLTTGLADLMGRIIGHKYLEFLDTIEAHFYFPMAVAKESFTTNATIEVRVKAVGGSIDRAAGLAFGLKNIGNYYCFRINALDDNVVLYRYVNNRRQRLGQLHRQVTSQEWHTLRVEIDGGTIKGSYDGQSALVWHSDEPIEGYLGLWTKADSSSYFSPIAVTGKDGEKREF